MLFRTDHKIDFNDLVKQLKRENSSLPVAIRVSKTRVLKLPIKTSSADRPRAKAD